MQPRSCMRPLPELERLFHVTNRGLRACITGTSEQLERGRTGATLDSQDHCWVPLRRRRHGAVRLSHHVASGKGGLGACLPQRCARRTSKQKKQCSSVATSAEDIVMLRCACVARPHACSPSRWFYLIITNAALSVYKPREGDATGLRFEAPATTPGGRRGILRSED